MAKRRERGTIDLIRELRSGAMVGTQLSPQQRCECVGRLTLEGVPVSEIADLLGRCDRTIRRDLQKIRSDNALQPSEQFEAEILGEYRTQVELAVSRLARLQRDPNASAADKINGVTSATLIIDRFIERLGSLGLIGTDRRHPTEAMMMSELIQVVTVVSSELGDGSPLIAQLGELMARMEGSERAGD